MCKSLKLIHPPRWLCTKVEKIAKYFRKAEKVQNEIDGFEWKGSRSQKNNASHLDKDILFDYVDVTEIFFRYFFLLNVLIMLINILDSLSFAQIYLPLNQLNFRLFEGLKKKNWKRYVFPLPWNQIFSTCRDNPTNFIEY